MLKAGVFLQNRYEIISRIGSGGMADVYKARDHKLNRYVAVKVLKQEFKDDKAFVFKFRVEAQAAAGLAHSNIVNVYDVGEDRGTSFIVMELVEGITLKTYIGKKGKLSVREATSIALQVSAGLEAAHNNGIVHRDVKPQNIIISLDGKAKVADFGIARAANSNTISSSAMGSVHYSSPEQTRGGYSDAKSDIYSMGITMFEMLTGRVPFDGDSTVEVALKHLQEEIPSPRKFTPDIPFSTEQIVLKCTQKSPDRRYNNMGELILDLKESLVNPGGNFVTIPTVDRKAHTVKLSKEELSQLKKSGLPQYDRTLNTGAAGQVAALGNESGDRRMYPYGGNYYQSSGYQDVSHMQERQGWNGMEYTPDSYDSPYQNRMDYEPEGTDDAGGDYQDEDTPQTRRQRRYGDDDDTGTGAERMLTVVSIMAAVAVVLVILFFVGRYLGLFGRNAQQGQNNTQGTETVTQVTVPKLIGHTESEAQTLLKDAGLGYHFQGESASAEYPKGQVISQSVPAGDAVEKNTTISYVLSAGSEQTLTVPELSGHTKADAESALKGMGLEVSVDTSRYSESIAEGNVITTNPGAGSTVHPGAQITIYVSQGPEGAQVEVPEVVGHYVNEANQALQQLGLYAYFVEVTSDTVEKGIVISQDKPAYSSVSTGTAITLTVSAGPADPEVYGQEGGTGVWSCNAQLSAPEGYDGSPVRIVLEQNDTQTVIFEGTPTFPYFLSVEGIPGVTEGTVYIYTLDASTWEVKDTIMYSGVAFSEQEG